ncbi:hypothetical protein BK881_000415 [Salmonella enterica subsp. enterica]|nr:hypothetical protein [Salmonella enterica subsp. enterica]
MSTASKTTTAKPKKSSTSKKAPVPVPAEGRIWFIKLKSLRLPTPHIDNRKKLISTSYPPC